MIPFARIIKYGNAIEVPKISSVPGNFNSSFVLMSTGELYGAGLNSNGAFGNGNAIPSYGKLTLLKSNIKYCNMGAASVYIDNDNKIFWSGSYYTFNQAGNTITTWTDVTGFFTGVDISNIKHVVPGYTSFVLMNDGKLYGRGFNRGGTIGLGNTNYVNTWTLMASDVNEIYSEGGGDTLIQFKNDGTIWGTGSNNNKTLGVTTNPVSTPVQMFTSVGPFELNAFWFNGTSCALITKDNKIHLTGSDNVSSPDLYKTVTVPFNVGDCSKLYTPMHSGNVNSSRVFLWNMDSGNLMSSGNRDVNGFSGDRLPMFSNFASIVSVPFSTDIHLGGFFYGNVWYNNKDIWMNGYPPSSTAQNNYSYTSTAMSYVITKQNGLPI